MSHSRITSLVHAQPSLFHMQEVIPKRRKARRRKKGNMEPKQDSSSTKDAKDPASKEEGVEGTDSVESKGVCVCVTNMLSRSQGTGTGEVHACKEYMYVCAE